MATTSQRLKAIRRELQAQKIAYSQGTLSLPLHTISQTFSTKKNLCHVHDLWYPGSDYDYEGYEQVIVTLNTPTGENTLATLEMTGDYLESPTVRRLPYLGGARWSVITSPNYIWIDKTWIPTNYNFTVQSLVDGTLDIRMVWEL